ncbi:PAS domain-containing sensor histidine kinase [Clostridium gasigenes]|uniref:PAS domain-containing sensor histidine kinase n=1 Tax=Clostridium gasigenes TaxID=94869 RepID=UPI001C0D04E3|nr:PAS domain-containing sensor histidine kinase [Clostridium gasigenes]MBU3089057.1 PAS domain-containing sensor histidine kinase [Clostridium gasigenes]
MDIGMEMSLINTKDKKLINRKIKIVLLLSIITISIFIINLINIDKVNIFSNEMSSSIISINYVLAFMAVITCWLYYYMYKKDEFFVITLLYISIVSEYLCETIFMIKSEQVSKMIGLLIFTSIFRMILITLIIKEDNKLTKWLNKRRELSVIISVVVTVALILLEIHFKYSKLIISSRNVIIILNLGIIVYYSIVMTILAIKIIKKSDFIWGIIIASINMFILRKIYSIMGVYNFNFNVNVNLYSWCKIFTACGFFILIIGLFIEIVSRVKENEALKEELQVFYNLTDQNPINNVIMYNEKNEVIYANKLMRDNGYSEGNDKNNTYKNINILNNNIDIKEINQININNQKNSKNVYFKDIIFLKSGSIVKLDIRQVEINKTKSRRVVSFRDITEDYKRNREIKINENKFITMTESIKDIIYTLDLDGNITYVNTMVEQVVGYSKEELIGEKYNILLDEIQESTYNFLKNNYKDSAFMEHDVVCKDKSIIVMESVVSRIYTDNNELVGHVIVSRDISYRNEFEYLKLKYNEMKAYDKIRNEFFANLSHEIRTPINIIYSCFQLLSIQKENGAESLAIYYNKYEGTIKQNCFRMLRLVNNLIDISKIDSGFIKMKFGNHNIINLVEDITLSIVPYVEAKKINIMFDTEVEELEIKCDPDEIERVMLNIISNAIKFNDVGGNIFVNISVNETWVEISVKDTGIGVSKELREYIFERFIQSDKSLNRKKEGSGIGLALVKSLVELHNGEVYLNDNEGKGSEFIVRLPNIICENIQEEVKNISGNNSKPTEEKISIELSDIYDLL